MLANSPRGFNFDLGETADAIRESVAAFAQDKIAPLAGKIDREDWFPRHLWPEMGALGLHGITVPEEDGGTGLGYLDHVVAMEEISRASASVGQTMVWVWQRLRMVGSSWWAASLASTKRHSPGGSSRVLRMVLAVTWFMRSAG